MAEPSRIHLGGTPLSVKRVLLCYCVVWGLSLGFTFSLYGRHSTLLALISGVVVALVWHGFFWSRGALLDLQRREIIRWSGPFFPLFRDRLPLERFRQVGVGRVVRDNLQRHSFITGRTPTSSSFVVNVEETYLPEQLANWDPYAPQPEVVPVGEFGSHEHALRHARDLALLLGLPVRDDHAP